MLCSLKVTESTFTTASRLVGNCCWGHTPLEDRTMKKIAVSLALLIILALATPPTSHAKVTHGLNHLAILNNAQEMSLWLYPIHRSGMPRHPSVLKLDCAGSERRLESSSTIAEGPDGFAIAVCPGSNQLAVVHWEGASFAVVNHINSGGNTPVTVVFDFNLVCVAHEDGAVVCFWFQDGKLTPMEGGSRQLSPGARPIRIGRFKHFVVVADAANKEAALCRIIREGLAPCVHNVLKYEPVGFYADGDQIIIRNGGADIYTATRYMLDTHTGALVPAGTEEKWTSNSYSHSGNSYTRTPEGLDVFLQNTYVGSLILPKYDCAIEHLHR